MKRIKYWQTVSALIWKDSKKKYSKQTQNRLYSLQKEIMNFDDLAGEKKTVKGLLKDS